MTEPEATGNRNAGMIPMAIVLLAASFIVGLTPRVGAIGAILVIVSVIILFVEHARMKRMERRFFYASVIMFFATLVYMGFALIAAFSMMIGSIDFTRSLTASEIQGLINNILPFAIPAAIAFEVTVLLLPYGFAQGREKWFLFTSFGISVAVALAGLFMFMTGYISLSSSQAGPGYGIASYVLANSIILEIFSVVSAVAWFASYLVIGVRLYRAQSPGRSY